jgi:hypothetical protein
VTPDDVFIGPILRRVEEGLVVVCFATWGDFDLRFCVKSRTDDELGADESPIKITVLGSLVFYFAMIRPTARTFPTNQVLQYSVGVKGNGETAFDEAPFAHIVEIDGLSYRPWHLPTFFLQGQGRPLTVLYGSCRKMHDAGADALVQGDALLERAADDLARRPAAMCLGGDQVYADDVSDEAAQVIATLAAEIDDGSPERLVADPGFGGRKAWLQREAQFTSGDLRNHVARLSEYLALYGLSWNVRNWRCKPDRLAEFIRDLPAVRRLLANVPTYMVFDDHDVTDDWNLDVAWREKVYASPLGHRIIGNALVTYWLCQGLGDDPEAFAPRLPELVEAVASLRASDPPGWKRVEEMFWAVDTWEFVIPTRPLIFCLDTRTQRAHADAPGRSNPHAPAFLKSPDAWRATMKKLTSALQGQRPELPIVLVSAVPVFGFGVIDMFHELLAEKASAEQFDFESWVGNPAQFAQLLERFAGRRVVVMSGDVHYGYTATVKHLIFDSSGIRSRGPRLTPTGALPRGASSLMPSYQVVHEARFIQLTSSALKNSTGGVKEEFLARTSASLSDFALAAIVDEDGVQSRGDYQNGGFVMLERDPNDPRRWVFERRAPHEVRPVTLLKKRVNDRFNSRFVAPHNLGVATFSETSVDHCFLTPSGPHSERHWDFGNAQYWS